MSILEEGGFPLDKHGMSWNIPAPTTIIATANPIGSRWSNRDVISTDEIAMLKTLLDRFQQVYFFRDEMDEEQIDQFVNAMSAINKRRPHNYNFLKKYIIYASAIEVKTITPEAELMLNQFWKDAKIKRNVGVRMYVGLYSIAQDAKLHLKDTVDAAIAKETIELVQIMMAQTGSTVKIPSDPKAATHDKFIEILQNNKAGVAIKSLCEIGCKENPQIVSYLGKNWSIKHNHKLRSVVELLRNHSEVKETGSNPLVFQWIGEVGEETKILSDISDVSDVTFNLEDDRNRVGDDNNRNKTMSLTSPASPSNQKNEPRPPLMEECSKCGERLEAFYLRHSHHCEGTD